ncbi:MAG: biotin transporter BioY [Proteobacteria bacterium]|nr:biotin transporter BioY [Pseudomonadota bacterium]
MTQSATALRWLSAWYAAPIAVLLGSLVLAASSYVEAPMWPVPITLQTYAVCIIGALFGARLAAATVVAYLIEGAVGLPVFAGGAGGFAHLLGPTGGYLVGFLIAATLTGALVERGFKSFTALLGVMLLAHIVIFAFGVLQLQLFVGWAAAWSSGVAPFLIGTMIKTAAAAATVRAAAPLLNRP